MKASVIPKMASGGPRGTADQTEGLFEDFNVEVEIELAELVDLADLMRKLVRVLSIDNVYCYKGD